MHATKPNQLRTLSLRTAPSQYTAAPCRDLCDHTLGTKVPIPHTHGAECFLSLCKISFTSVVVLYI